MSGKPPELQCYLLDTGYCLTWEHHLIAGGQRRRVACHSLVALLHHPDHGWLLWDTGYAPRMLAVTQDLPFSLYRRATPLHLDARLSVAAQLERWQLRPQDIKRVLISHFHADHIAGLRDFPEAEFIATQSAYTDVADRRGLAALRRAFIPALLPTDFAARATLLSDFAGTSLPALGATHDLFHDGSLLLFSLPGHARGQMGLLAHTQRGRILFAADGAWLKRSIDEQRSPSRLTSLFIDDARAVQTTLQRLHAFQQQQPDILIIPSHCPATFAQEVEGADETV
ncbi:MBL fold metallo-hydrolase [Reticulibacter mediterranei]|uniref:MBL fold metallo-hydrolase n=1 Tax=Reticulibacter mediterranei TaxID=2778369 RepID=A0A8J3N471_9CHLR|nr:MBL fold metallo-hydrolase [Reticulibacter mediterranei]GHO97734.1 MBL fold metallo-hydrolase [Reticulibacter mediterranei]